MIQIKNWFIPLSIHPLFFCVISFILGISFQSSNSSFYLSFIIWIAFIGLSYLLESYMALCVATSFICGAALYQQTINRFEVFHEHIKTLPLDITMTITDISTTDHPFLKHKIQGKIDTLEKYPTQEYIAHSQQNLVWYISQQAQIAINDKVKFTNAKIVQPKNESMNFYFQKNNIAGTIFAKDYQIIPQASFSIARTIYEFRASIVENLKKKLSFKTSSFLLLLFFGSKEIKKKQLSHLYNDCKQWGISHYLARSGLHLILFIILWEMLLKLFAIPFLLKQLALCVITLIYVLLSWPTVSFIRSLAGFLLYKFGTLSYNQIHSVHLFTIITIATLLINPLYLFFLDFQLSFGITFLLTWANHLSTQQSLHSS